MNFKPKSPSTKREYVVLYTTYRGNVIGRSDVFLATPKGAQQMLVTALKAAMRSKDGRLVEGARVTETRFL